MVANVLAEKFQLFMEFPYPRIPSPCISGNMGMWLAPKHKALKMQTSLPKTGWPPCLFKMQIANKFGIPHPYNGGGHIVS